MKHFQLVDVFGGESFKGNALAVVMDAEDLSTEAMQDITRWLNLSETTFLLPPTEPEADYRVRIFTLDRELPFAGHPTLGTCHAWLRGGGKPKSDKIIQQCTAGLVPIRQTEAGLAFAAPPLVRSGPISEDELAKSVEILGISKDDVVDAQWIDNGPGWVGILLKSAEEVLALQPVGTYPDRVHIGVVGPHATGSDISWELRAVISDHQRKLLEDPVTGSLNASVAQWLIGSGRSGPRYKAAQGTVIGRTGRIAVEQDDEGAIWIAGNTKTMFEGQANF